jgi:hypothetical protein
MPSSGHHHRARHRSLITADAAVAYSPAMVFRDETRITPRVAMDAFDICRRNSPMIVHNA